MAPVLHKIIDAAYELFAPYTVGPALDVCKVCCVSDAEEQELLRTPLRAVSAAVLNAAAVPQRLAQQLEHLIHHNPTLDAASHNELSRPYEVLQAALI